MMNIKSQQNKNQMLKSDQSEKTENDCITFFKHQLLLIMVHIIRNTAMHNWDMT